MIAINGGKNVDLENTQLYKKAGRHSFKSEQLCKAHVVSHDLLYL